MNIFKLFFGKEKSEEKIEKRDANIKNNHPEWDEVFEARMTTDLNKMLEVVNLKTDLVNRHFLLQTIVSETYKLREQENFKILSIKYSEIHIAEFPKIAVDLRKEMDGILPRITTFQNYATLLTEIGDFDKAISVCEMAMSFGLNDGTKSNYQGRIERIKKKDNLEK